MFYANCTKKSSKNEPNLVQYQYIISIKRDELTGSFSCHNLLVCIRLFNDIATNFISIRGTTLPNDALMMDMHLGLGIQKEF